MSEVSAGRERERERARVKERARARAEALQCLRAEALQCFAAFLGACQPDERRAFARAQAAERFAETGQGQENGQGKGKGNGKGNGKGKGGFLSDARVRRLLFDGGLLSTNRGAVGQGGSLTIRCDPWLELGWAARSPIDAHQRMWAMSSHTLRLCSCALFGSLT